MEAIYLLIFLVIIAGILWYIFFYKKDSSKSGAWGSATTVLSKYSRDLTKLAAEKKLDPVIGRQAEITRVIQILSRRNKNNPVLIGAAGIGKTAIVEGLALAMKNGQVPQVLTGKKVLALDLPNILAGTKYRGEFEQRLKKIIDEIVSARRMIILFIDEIHILAEAGEAEGAINAADILKPMLARGELQVVGATTKEEYEKYIKMDKTLDRRLQPIFVSEPNAKEVKEILIGIKNVYEEYHQVNILPSAIDEAIKSTKFITSRSYPDKAIDAIDEASSRVRLEVTRSEKNANKIPEVSDKEIKLTVAQWKNN
ncbi:MAG TPA: AAA family ATPase [Patescibacteria group bacterium]|nr:AAA family ATPase [Patescibacteria group bacterium]